MASKLKKSGNGPREGFWQKPQQMHLLADLLLFVGTAALLYALGLTILRLPVFALREVVLLTPLAHVTPVQLESAVKDALSGNFFTVNLEQLRASVGKQPWVKKVAVRRRWPDTVELEVEEQLAVAQWQEGESGVMQLVNPQGELFAATSQETMPLLSGPRGRAPEVLARFREFSLAVKPLARSLTSVSLSAREAWSLHLDNGLVLELGRDQTKAHLAERLERFVRAYRDTAERFKTPMLMADLRYPNGFAVRLAKTSATEIKGKK